MSSPIRIVAYQTGPVAGYRMHCDCGNEWVRDPLPSVLECPACRSRRCGGETYREWVSTPRPQDRWRGDTGGQA